MPADRSSKPSPGRLSSFHIVVSSFAAIAGVALAAYQVLAPSSTGQPPVNVTVALAPQAAGKANLETDIAMAAVDLGRSATFMAALHDGSGQRYAFEHLFDGKAETFLTISPPDTELNVLVTFKEGQPQGVTAITYTPPSGTAAGKLANVVDVTILPDGAMEASGRPVYTFALQTSPGSQTFAIPGRASGKGVWLRIGGGHDTGGVAVGDFRIINEQIAQ